MEDCAIVAGEEAALIVGFALVTEGVVHEDFYFAIFAGLWMGEAKAAGEVFGGVGACVAIMGEGEEFHGVGFVVTGRAQGELVGVAIDLKAGREKGGGGDFSPRLERMLAVRFSSVNQLETSNRPLVPSFEMISRRTEGMLRSFILVA